MHAQGETSSPGDESGEHKKKRKKEEEEKYAIQYV